MIRKIEQRVGIANKTINTFWEVCPIEQDLLFSRSRLAEVVFWRNIGMVWYRLCGYTQMDVKNVFKRTGHTDVVVAEKRIMDALNGFNQALKEQFEKLTLIDWRFNKTEDVYVNEMRCVVLMENKIRKVLE